MQTFLPYPDFRQTARSLDPTRLGNQFWRECKALARGAWAVHPASTMWRGHTAVLCDYALALYDEIVRRWRNTWGEKLVRHRERYIKYTRHAIEFRNLRRWAARDEGTDPPWWLGNHDFHRAHRSKLMGKRPAWYRQYWDTPDGLPYLWPTNEKTFRIIN